MKHLLIPLMLAALFSSALAGEPLRVENSTYKFAFTFEPPTELTYESDGVGIAGSHVPTGAKRSDYGILVYGSPAMSLTAAEAKAAKLGSEDMLLNAVDVADAAKWTEAFTAIMEARKATQAGEASVKSGAANVSIPYYTWEQNVLGRTRHALMYVVKHGDAFIYVQVESNKAFSKSQQAWMASKLELL